MQATAEKIEANPIGSHTEWGTLKEVIVGSPVKAMVPADMRILETVVPSQYWELLGELFPGLEGAYPDELVGAAVAEVTEFKNILRGEGVVVHEAEPLEFCRSTQTPFWQVNNSFCCSNPRDSLMIVGDTIIEAPMADRNRIFETYAYRNVLSELSTRGWRWISAPKPALLDSLYQDVQRDENALPTRWLINESEICFDGADFIKCGRDLIVTVGHVTNERGIQWLESVIGDEYKIHRLATKNPYAMHIDDNIMPLAPGVLLVNPDYVHVDRLPSFFDNWEKIIAPRPRYTDKNVLGSLSGWLNINLLSLDEKRVIVEKEQHDTIALLKKKGFQPIPCSFESYYPFIGSFHCATLDVSREGFLDDYR